jgi:hypothetical protein
MEDGDMKMRCQWSQIIWKSLIWVEQGYREDDVIYEHLYELSDGKINMLDSSEALLNTTDLLRTNKRIEAQWKTQQRHRQLSCHCIIRTG